MAVTAVSNFVRGDVGSEAAEASDDREQDPGYQGRAGGVLQAGGQKGFKVEGAGNVEEPGKPPQARFCLGGEEGGGGYEGDGDGENLSAEQGPAKALEGSIAAAKLGAPPEDSRGFEAGLGGGGGAFPAERLSEQDALGAGFARGDVVAEILRAGFGPVSGGEGLGDFFLAIAVS